MAQSVLTEKFLRGSNNLIRLQLTEAGSVITWLSDATEVTLTVGKVSVVRVADADGIDFTTTPGTLVINPGEVTEAVNFLDGNRNVTIRVKTATNLAGVIWGGEDSDSTLVFDVSDPT